MIFQVKSHFKWTPCATGLCVMRCGGRVRHTEQESTRQAVHDCNSYGWTGNLVRSVVYSSWAQVVGAGAILVYVDILRRWLYVLFFFFPLFLSFTLRLFEPLDNKFHRADFLVFTVKYFLYGETSVAVSSSHMFSLEKNISTQPKWNKRDVCLIFLSPHSFLFICFIHKFTQTCQLFSHGWCRENSTISNATQ